MPRLFVFSSSAASERLKFCFHFFEAVKIIFETLTRDQTVDKKFFWAIVRNLILFSRRLSEMMFPPTTCCSCAWMMNLTLERRIQPSFVSSLDQFWAKIWAILRVHFLVRKTYGFSVFIGSSSFLSSSARFENRDVCCCCCCTHTRHWPDEMSLSTL